MTTFTLFILLFVCMIIGMPIAIALGFASMTTILLFSNDSLASVALKLFEATSEHYTLLAIPFFILSSAFLSTGGVARRLINFAMDSVGHIRGGLAMASVLACMLFAAVSGSSPATVAAIGSIVIAGMVRSGYPESLAAGVIANAGTLGILIPPSIAYIVIGLVLGVPTATLFTAAIIPGVMVLGTIMLTNSAINRISGYEHSTARFELKIWLKTIWDGKYAILVPFIILGGIYSGIFTPTEAAAIAVVTTIVIGIALGTLHAGDIPKMLISSAKVNGVILPTVALSLPLAEAIGAIGIPQAVIEGMLGLTENRVIIILMMMVIFIIAGCVMEAVPNIVLIAPVLFPLAAEIGMDDIHFCIMMVTSLGIGFVTPPIGLNLFVITGITGEPIMKVAGYAAPFVGAMLVVAFILAYVPWFSLVLLY